MNYANTWGVYQAFQGIDDALIAIEDRIRFFEMDPYGKVFECVKEAEKITLRYGDFEYRVNPQRYKVVKEPKHKIGDKVNIISKSEIGQIIDIYWHYKMNVPFYLLQINGNKSTRRYFERKLVALQSSY